MHFLQSHFDAVKAILAPGELLSIQEIAKRLNRKPGPVSSMCAAAAELGILRREDKADKSVGCGIKTFYGLPK
ncbi:MAG: MarR family transcriptional regulator [Patescibacteria group bacterium]|nr:MarR family transcriptional regulator [Patescibacteria group bacterium]